MHISKVFSPFIHSSLASYLLVSFPYMSGLLAEDDRLDQSSSSMWQHRGQDEEHNDTKIWAQFLSRISDDHHRVKIEIITNSQ